MAMQISLPYRSRVASPGPFNFHHYLSAIDPYSQYHIHILKNSPAKYVVRAVRVSKDDRCRWPDKTKLILEFAPPHEPAAGPGGPLLIPQDMRVSYLYLPDIYWSESKCPLIVSTIDG